ncbi:MAG: permease prefix domain 1-containing protein [Clostridiales bacterium]|nr:permease prefix domain 1-containing protein [Clostridiales bacterium]
MKEEFRKYLDKQFSSYKQSKALSDFKEEMLANLSDRYDEFKAQGFSDKESYDKSIEAVGDYTDILKNIDANTPARTIWTYSKLMTSLSALYFVLLVIVYIGVSFALRDKWGSTWLIMLSGGVLYAVAAFVIGAKNAAVNQKNGRTRFLILMIFLAATLLAYFSVSFITGAWTKTWLAFICFAALWLTADSVIAGRSGKKSGGVRFRVSALISIWTVAAYLSVSVLVGGIWAYSWLIILLGAAALFTYYAVVSYGKYKDEIKSGK